MSLLGLHSEHFQHTTYVGGVEDPTAEGLARLQEDEVRRILAGDRPASVASQDVAFVEGYRDAMKFVLNRADDQNDPTVMRLPTPTIRRIAAMISGPRTELRGLRNSISMSSPTAV